MDAPLGHMDAAILPEDMKKRVENGMPVPLSAVRTFRKAEGNTADSPAPGQAVCVYLGERFAGIALAEEDQLRFKAMLLEK